MTMLSMTPAEYLARRKSGELWRLLDVREPWETEIASVQNAILLPMQELPARLAELDPAEPVAVMCHTGGRSARVAGFLLQQGFTTVANLEGGIDAWAEDVDPGLARY